MRDDRRQQRAVAAAVATARTFALSVVDPLVMTSSNSTVVWLRPLPLVAKVVCSSQPGAVRRLALELDVLTHLQNTDAPVAHLAPDLPFQLHQADGHCVLLLEHVDHDPDRPLPTVAARKALLAVHRHLLSYTGTLPTFTDQLIAVRSLLASPTATPGLAPADRTLLARMTEQFQAAFVFGPTWQPIHGDPWFGGNLLATSTGAVLVDFEAACRGPVEWDWSSLPIDVAPSDLDKALAIRLRVMRSLVVAVWCLARPNQGTAVDDAARHHLAVVRAASSTSRSG